MKKSSNFFNFLLTTKRGGVGLAIAVSLALLTNLVSAILATTVNNSIPGLLTIITAIILIIFFLYLFRNGLQKKPDFDYTTSSLKPKPHKGLIVLVSRGRIDRDPMEQSAGPAIQYHIHQKGIGQVLQHCWLIATSGPDGSHDFAHKLSELCKEQGIKTTIEVVSDGFSVQETYDLVRRIYAEAETTANLAPHDIIADFTGGLKPMSAGMVLACGAKYPIQYMYGGKAGIASVPRQITLDN